MKVVVQTSESAIKTFRLLSNLTIKNIINYIKESGPSPPSKIARGVGISPSTASRCLQDMLKYNIVKAKWVTTSLEDRPLKVFSLVPNILRFEFVLNDPNIRSLKPTHEVRFLGSHFMDFKEEEAAFRFDGTTAEVLREIARGSHTVDDLKSKFRDKPEELNSALKHLLTLGMVEAGPPKE
jgi:DNA-binding Lrp family transcriptional regulator